MGNKTTAIVGPGGPDDPAALRAQIAETRMEMSGTLEELHGRLNPTVLKEQALDQFHEATEKVKAELKEHFQDAKESLKTHLQEARVAIKHEVSQEISHAKQAVRDATIGKVETMVHKTQDRVRDARESVVDLVTENPIPAAITGIGLVWLLLSGRRNARDARPRSRQRMLQQRSGVRGRTYEDDYLPRSARGYVDYNDHDDHQDSDGARGRMGQAREYAGNAGRRIAHTAHDAASAVSHVAHDAGDAVAGAAHTARDAVAGAAHRVGDTAVDLAHGARDGAVYVARGARTQARRIQRGSRDMYRENPLAIGAAMIAVGAVVGLALPRTELEDEWMGAARDRVIDKAEDVAQEAVSKVSVKVQELGDSAASNPSDFQGESGMNGRYSSRT